jgi:predicted transcriptional regulator
METTEIKKNIHEELRSIITSIEQISGSLDRIATGMETLSRKAPATAIKAKRSPVRKKVLIKDGVVQRIKRIPSTQIIYDILLKSARGMDTTALMKATGFNQRKVHNVTFRLKNQGKIKNVERGIYKTV